ncbi:THO complex subunit 4 [Drosophila erecta]|uniref:RRM domain-containing protein n=1 Tax=Drosophila erecta TaxID=7220 RepID=B3N3E1_DROER|nr:THO complex subunit 4 [Drosophila erecta]EDV58781.1 uncharacterized protein Dere_GG10249 [Drosophila erecta]
MLDKMQMSLEDIIKLNKVHRAQKQGVQRGSTRKPNSKGGLKGILRPRNGTGYIHKAKFNRENALRPPKKHTFLMVCNLNYALNDDDIMELFNENGLVEKGFVHYDRDGNSLGTAQLMCRYRADAMMIIRQFHGVHVDGRRLKIHLIQKTRNCKRPVQNHYYQSRPVQPGFFRTLSFSTRPLERNSIQVDSSTCESRESSPHILPKTHRGTYRTSGVRYYKRT